MLGHFLKGDASTTPANFLQACRDAAHGAAHGAATDAAHVATNHSAYD